jgi:hypothetical protein
MEEEEEEQEIKLIAETTTPRILGELPKKCEVAVDFDGTCVTHEYPKIGRPIGAEHVLRRLVANGHRIILFTMRSGKELDEAVRYLELNGVRLYGINVNPTQKNWTDSTKAYAQLYIDDAALGCPVKEDPDISSRPFVDWFVVEEMLTAKGLI